MELFKFLAAVSTLVILVCLGVSQPLSAAPKCGKTVTGAPQKCITESNKSSFDAWINIFAIPGLVVEDFSEQEVFSGSTQKKVQRIKARINDVPHNIMIEKSHYGWDEDLVTPRFAKKYWKNINWGTVKGAERIRTNSGWGVRVDIVTNNGRQCAGFIFLSQDTKILGDFVTCSPDNFEHYFRRQFRRSNRAENIAEHNANQTSLSVSTTTTQKSFKQRKCEAAQESTGSMADFMQGLTKNELTKFLDSSQNCTIF